MEQRGVGVRRLGAWSFSEKKLGKDFFAPGGSVQLVEKSRSGQENPRNPSAFLGKIWPGYAQIWLDLARFGLSLEIGRLPCRRLRRRRGRCYAPRLRPSQGKREPEGWPSGRRRTPGKCVCGKPYRGFESRPLRQKPIKPRLGLVSISARGIQHGASKSK